MDSADDIVHIYSTLRLLAAPGTIQDNSLFPRALILRLLDDRLAEVETHTSALIHDLFRAHSVEPPVAISTNSPQSKTRSEITESNGRLIIDKCFCIILVRLHDFFVELDWPETADVICDLSTCSKSDLDNLKRLCAFFEFRANLNKSISALKSPKATISSPKRRVRFNIDANKVNDLEEATRLREDEERRMSHSIFALELTLYALGIVASQLTAQVATVQAALKPADLLERLKMSTQKIRASQVNNIARKVSDSNDAYLVPLDILHLLKSQYLNDYLLNVLYGVETKQMLDKFKRPRVAAFASDVGDTFEGAIIHSLATYNLRLAMDLIVVELNTSPITTAAQQKVKSRENYLSFMTSLLNFIPIQIAQTSRVLPESTLAQANTKSSQILTQIDSLNTVISSLITNMVKKLKSTQQVGYLLQMLAAGFDSCFDSLLPQMKLQIEMIKVQRGDPEGISKQLSLKVRCLKFVFIFASVDKLLIELSRTYSFKLDFVTTEKVDAFTNFMNNNLRS